MHTRACAHSQLLIVHSLHTPQTCTLTRVYSPPHTPVCTHRHEPTHMWLHGHSLLRSVEEGEAPGTQAEGQGGAAGDHRCQAMELEASSH
jgi:hypothetical protein